jgi:transcription-repair coupling factor (superfamily II helicase)
MQTNSGLLGVSTLCGVAAGYIPFAIRTLFYKNKRPLVFIASCDEDRITLENQLAFLMPETPCFSFPCWDCLPYDRIGPSNDCMAKRLSTLHKLTNATEPYLLVTSIQAMVQKVTPKHLVAGRQRIVQVGQKLDRTDFLAFLTSQGFQRQETVYEAGDFAVRGSIIDLFPTSTKNPLRLDFFGDTLESIRAFDAVSQGTLNSIDSFSLMPAKEVLLTPTTIEYFRANYRLQFQPNKQGMYDDPLYENIVHGAPYAGMEHWLPLFYPDLAWLTDYINPQALFVFDHTLPHALTAHLTCVSDYYTARLQPSLGGALYHPIQPELLYGQEDMWNQWLSAYEHCSLTPFVMPPSAHVNNHDTHPAPDFSGIRQRMGDRFFETLAKIIDEHKDNERRVVIVSGSLGSQKRLEGILEHHSIYTDWVKSWPFDRKGVYSVVAPFDTGFVSGTEVVLTEQDILGYRLARKPQKRNGAAFFQDASDLATGDLIVHQDHGIGRYLGLKTININNSDHDCLMLAYADDSKLFLPVENIDAITRYGSDSALVPLDRLGASGWQNRKNKVKKRIRVVAEYLLKVAAERALHRAPALEKIDLGYDAFCAGFPYVETEDQQRAIEETLEDMASGRPMDRLVCGDVGFGKTEVALRAAYIAACHGKQVAVVVPTTLLCRQHYQNFAKRFEGTPFRVAQLSRLVKNHEQIRSQLASGEINIVIATHTILSEKTTFHDLGLLIVDEEQHFGVKQKETLKKLKADVHVLTLTATPIPRTLQLALSGVRELSLMTTPPIDRLAVRTFVMPFDPMVIREAILREYHRGGQIFYVSPHIEDLDDLSKTLKKLVPEIKFAVAHGKLPVNDLERIVGAFYDHEYHLLLSTNIIESGIDIPTANTLIVNRADRMGLAQLYQLRGRVGRSKTQGYAYLTLPADKAVSETAEKRLHVMQSLDTLGAGFRVASHDMDIRGAGNVVGEEQSGHIREVGVELYQTLLQEAIIMVRAEQANAEDQGDVEAFSPQINVGTAVLIPETYVADLGLRINLYRRMGTLKTKNDLESFAAELIDRFGPLPKEVQSLVAVIELKILCRRAGIEKIELGPKGLVISFRKNVFANQKGLLEFLQKPEVTKPGPVKIRPDQKLVFVRQWPNEEVSFRNTKNILANLVAIQG